MRMRSWSWQWRSRVQLKAWFIPRVPHQFKSSIMILDAAAQVSTLGVECANSHDFTRITSLQVQIWLEGHTVVQELTSSSAFICFFEEWQVAPSVSYNFIKILFQACFEIGWKFSLCSSTSVTQVSNKYMQSLFQNSLGISHHVVVAINFEWSSDVTFDTDIDFLP